MYNVEYGIGSYVPFWVQETYLSKLSLFPWSNVKGSSLLLVFPTSSFSLNDKVLSYIYFLNISLKINFFFLLSLGLFCLSPHFKMHLNLNYGLISSKGQTQAIKDKLKSLHALEFKNLISPKVLFFAVPLLCSRPREQSVGRACCSPGHSPSPGPFFLLFCSSLADIFFSLRLCRSAVLGSVIQAW